MGNADAHAKNFSLLYQGAKPQLAPAYDLLSTAVYPDLSVRLAMKIGGKYKPQEIYLRHFYKLVADNKTAQSLINRQLITMTNKTLIQAKNLKSALKADGIGSDIFGDIINIIEERAERLTK